MITTDVATVDAAIADGRPDFEQAYREHFDEIYRYVWHRTFDRPLAEDIVAETFLRAWRHLDGFQAVAGGMPAWLTTIARNLINDHYKRSSTRRETSVAEMLDVDLIEPGVDHAVLAGLTAAAVRAAVLRLGDHQRECITLRYLHGLSLADTAAALGIAVGAVKVLQSRAVKALADDWNLKKAQYMTNDTTWTVELPAGYSPATGRTLFQCGANARFHRMVRHRVTKDIRATAKLAALAARLEPITVPVEILAVQHPDHGKRALDSENIAPIAKAAIDGLRDAGLLRNDSPRYVVDVRYAVGERRPGSQLALHLTERDSEES